jgi:hypothetical protein
VNSSSTARTAAFAIRTGTGTTHATSLADRVLSRLCPGSNYREELPFGADRDVQVRRRVLP